MRFFYQSFGSLIWPNLPHPSKPFYDHTSAPMVPQKWGFEPQPSDLSFFLCVSCQIIVCVDPNHFFCEEYLEICCRAFYLIYIELRIQTVSVSSKLFKVKKCTVCFDT